MPTSLQFLCTSLWLPGSLSHMVAAVGSRPGRAHRHVWLSWWGCTLVGAVRTSDGCCEELGESENAKCGTIHAYAWSAGEPGDCLCFADVGGERHEPFVTSEFLRFLRLVRGHIFLTPLRGPAGRQNPETFAGMDRRQCGRLWCQGGLDRGRGCESPSLTVEVYGHCCECSWTLGMSGWTDGLSSDTL